MDIAKQKKCGNPLCKSEFATIDAICGALIEGDALECEFVNFSAPRKICSFEISFELNSSTALIVNSGLTNNEDGFYEEIFWVSGKREREEFEATAFTTLAESITHSISASSHLTLNHVSQSDFYDLSYAYLEPGRLKLILGINLDLSISAIPYDWIEYGPLAIADNFMNEKYPALVIDSETFFPTGVDVES